MRRVLLLLGSALLMTLAACGSNDSDRMVRTGEDKPVLQANGRLDREPTPITLAEVRKMRRTKPETTVMTLIFWAQWGSAPNIIDAYDPQVVRRVGVANITGPYSVLRAQLVASQPRIISKTTTPRGLFLGVELASKAYPLQRESFVLRRGRGGWKVIFDTLLERGLTGLVQESGSKSRQADAALARRGVAASQRYREAWNTLRSQQP